MKLITVENMLPAQFIGLKPLTAPLAKFTPPLAILEAPFTKLLV